MAAGDISVINARADVCRYLLESVCVQKPAADDTDLAPDHDNSKLAVHYFDREQID